MKASSRRFARWAAGLIGSLGVIFLVLGSGFLLSNAPARERARVHALPLARADSLARYGPPEVVVLEGELSSENQATFREFIAYRRDVFEGRETTSDGESRERWRHAETVTPSFVLNTPAGPVRIRNTDYLLINPPHRWRTAHTDSTFFQSRGERVAGFVAADAVTVEARLVASERSAGATPTVDALILFGGDYPTYLAHADDGILVARILGWSFLGAALLLLLVFVLILRRSRGRARTR